MGDEVRARLRIRGRVQMVGFRLFAAQAARRRGLRGFVRNLPDGSVETAAQGPRAEVEAFIAQVSGGPPGARVDAVEVAWEPPADDRGFHIRAD